jgi:hypothetical protein
MPPLSTSRAASADCASIACIIVTDPPGSPALEGVFKFSPRRPGGGDNRRGGAACVPGERQAQRRFGLQFEVTRMFRPIALSLAIGIGLAPHGAVAEPAAPLHPVGEAPPADNGASPVSSSAPGQGAPASTGTEQTGMLDTGRAAVHGAVEWAARGVDSWFGDKPFEEGGRVAGRIQLGTLWRQDEGNDWLTRFGVRLNLPNLREKGFLFIGRDNERDVITDKPDGFTRREQLLPETREDQSFFAGLGRQIADTVLLRAGFRGGLKPFAQARYERLFELGERDSIDFKETVFWTVDDGFGSTTALFYDHAFDRSLALRWQSAATLSQDTEGVEWSSSVGLYKRFGSQRLLSLEALVNGETGLDVDVTEYGFRTRWEQPIYRDWLLADMTVGYFFPRKEAVTERGRSWAIGASVVMRF